MKAEITSIPSVASYELLPDVADQVDPKKLQAAITAGGIDGIITMRMLGMEDHVKESGGYYAPTGYASFSSYYSPAYALAPYYHGMPGTYGVGMPMAYEYVPPTTTTDVVTSIETNIYDAKDGKLIRTGLTKTKNAHERHATISEIAVLVKSKLRDQKLIP